jgi:DNA-binding transcriptional regulator YdaS (Cro superfamily)
MKDAALAKAIHRAGGVRALARALGIVHQAVSHWQRTPVRRVIEIERLTGVPRQQLRPDIYPPRAPKSGSTSGRSSARPQSPTAARSCLSS